MKSKIEFILFFYILSSLGVACAQTIEYFPAGGMGLSNLHVQDIVQDRWGYIWIATARGLDRIDGYKTIFYLNNSGNGKSLSNDNVYKLFLSREGDLYVFTRWGINLYDRKGDNFIRFRGYNKNENYAFAEEDAEGRIWMATQDRISYINRASREVKELAPLSAEGRLKDLCGDGRGLLYFLAGENGKEIFSFDPIRRKIVNRIFYPQVVSRILRGPFPGSFYLITPGEVSLVGILGRQVKKLSSIFHCGKCRVQEAGVSASGDLFFLTEDLRFHLYNKKTGALTNLPLTGINNIYNITSLL